MNNVACPICGKERELVLTAVKNTCPTWTGENLTVIPGLHMVCEACRHEIRRLEGGA